MKRWLLIAAVALACGGFYFWWTQNFEKQSYQTFAGYEGEARINQFLAVQLLLGELGIEAESRQSLRPTTWMPAETDTIVTRLGPELATYSESFTLMDWVMSGGHLILFPALDETRDVTDFLEDINVRIVGGNYADDEDAEDLDEDAAQEEEEVDYVLDLNLVYHRIELVIEQEQGVTLSDDAGIIASRTAHGSGFVTVFSGSYWFTNGAIADHDHARLFVDAVAGYVDPGKVWLFYNTEFTPLWRLLWDTATWLVIGLVLAFVVWLWSRMPRFGPMLAAPSAERRSIAEHVSASGRFIWQNKASSALVKASVAAVIGQAERRHPGIGRLAREKQAVAIGRLTDEDPQAILQALLVEPDDRPREFAQHMKFLQKIRNSL